MKIGIVSVNLLNPMLSHKHGRVRVMQNIAAQLR